jgi:hypothetical protein
MKCTFKRKLIYYNTGIRRLNVTLGIIDLLNYQVLNKVYIIMSFDFPFVRLFGVR